jgi:hypothetical protein
MGRLLRALVAAAAAAAAPLSARAAPAFSYAAPGAFADSLCDVSFADAAGRVFEFDLRGVAAVAVNVSGGQGYQVAACGVLALSCAGQGLVTDIAPAVQLDGNGNCYETLATGPPLHELRDPANAATGGLVTRFQSAWTMSSDGRKCGDWNPAHGREMGRTLVIEHLCNASMAPGAVVAVASSEAPACTYTLTIASAAACGAVPRSQPAPPVVNPAGAPTTPPWAPGAGPYAPYVCSPTLADASGAKYAFALASLFSADADYVVKGADGTSYALNVCGNTRTTCMPAYSVAASFGALVAAWPGGAPPPPDAKCSWANGTTAPCTPPCRTLGEGAPLFSLLNASDGAAGGLLMAVQSELVSGDEPAIYQTCGYDGNGDALFPSVAAAIKCDPSVATLALDGVSCSSGADGSCVFTVQARSSKACGAPTR